MQALVECLKEIRPEASPQRLLDLLEQIMSFSAIPLNGERAIIVRLVEIFKTHAAARLKTGDGEMKGNGFCSEAVMEKALVCFRSLLERNASLAESMWWWTLFQSLLNLMCLGRKHQTSVEVRLFTLQCMDQLLRTGINSAEKLSRETLAETEKNNCIAFAAYKCFERVHEEHPKGEKAVARAAFGVLSSLLNVFCYPAMWFGILPSAATELAAYLTHTGKMIDNQDAVIPWSKVTVDALSVFAALLARVLPDTHVRNMIPKADATSSAKNLAVQLQRLRLPGPQQNVDVPSSQEGVKHSAVEGSWEWYQYSGKKCQSLLEQCLPSLTRHPNAAVRCALAQAVIQLGEECCICLEPSLETILKILLTLSADPYPSVAVACTSAIGVFRSRIERSDLRELATDPWTDALESLIKEEIALLPDALKESQSKAQASLQLLTAAITTAGGEACVVWIVEDALQLQFLYRALLCSFEFNLGMMHALYDTTAAPRMLLDSGSHSSQPPSFPRMPIALLYIMDQEAYDSLSNFVRTVGVTVAAKSERLHGLLDVFLNALQATFDSSEDHWRTSAASLICVISEILYGASKSSSLSSSSMESLFANTAQLINSMDLWHSVKDQTEGFLQMMGEHALLLRCLLDWVSVCAQALNKQLLDSACYVMQLILMPVLENVADSCPLIQGAAEDALQMLCHWLELESFSELVIAFSDYIVDGLCLQLRDILRHPRAPYTLAALLKRISGHPAQLISLFSEPASLALKALSIQGRASRHIYSVPFLEALIAVANVTLAEAEAVLLELNRVSTTNSRTLSDELSTTLSNRMKDLQSASFLAESVIHLATPLFVDDRIQVCLCAQQVCTVGIKALKSATECCRLFEEITDQFFPKDRPDASLVTMEIPRLSNVLQPVWKNLVTAMKRGHIAVVESTLQFFGNVATAFDGRMLSRRFADEAWPLIRTLLQRGSATPALQRIVPYRGTFAALQEPESDSASASKSRGQIATMSCLEKIGHDPIARACLKSTLPEIVDTLMHFLSCKNSSQLKNKAVDALKGVACVDVDYVWSILMEWDEEQHVIPLDDASANDLRSFLDSLPVTWHQRIRQIYLQLGNDGGGGA